MPPYPVGMGSVSAPALATALSGDAVHEAVVLLQRYTVEVTHALEEVLGAGATGNIDVGLLIAIHARPRLSPAEAGNVVGSPRSTVARGLARLVGSGLVERRTSADDRRRTELVLTRRGRRSIDRMNDVLDACYRDGEALAKEVMHLVGRQPPRSSEEGRASAIEVASRLGQAAERARAAVERAGHQFGLEGSIDRYAVVVVALGEIRPSRLAHELLLTPTGTSSLLDRLGARGLVERIPGAIDVDRRAVVVRATQRGRDTAAAIVTAYAPHLHSIADAVELTMGRY